MKTIEDFDFENKKAIVRVDFNVPLNEDHQVTDDTRIRAAVPTIKKILSDGGSCVLMSHLGRPKDHEDKYSLSHLFRPLSEILGIEVKWAEDCIGPKAEEAVENLRPGEVLLLENLRYYPEETAGDEGFAEKLAKLGDIYVNDAFGTAHREHASTATIARYFPENKCAGFLLTSEVEGVKKVLEENEKPVIAIIGGAKVSSKITLMENILDSIDGLIIGGGMAFTFIKANGGKVGDSLVEDDKLDTAKEIMKLAELKNVAIYLPSDVVVANKFSEDADTKIENADQISEGWMALDAGPETRKKNNSILAKARTILWNGPIGVFEMDPFAAGTKALAEGIAEATEKGAYSLVGGGDSVAAVKKFGLTSNMSYVSTGGGAMLEMLEGKILPGISALD